MYLCTAVIIFDDLRHAVHGQVLCYEGNSISESGLFDCSMFNKI